MAYADVFMKRRLSENMFIRVDLVMFKQHVNKITASAEYTKTRMRERYI